MNSSKKIIRNLYLGAILIFAVWGCTKESIMNTYNKQEKAIETYLEKKRYVKRTGQVEKLDPETNTMIKVDTAWTDTLRVERRNGSSRLVLTEGAENSPTLGEKGTVSLYYAAYLFSSDIRSSNMFATNHEESAIEAKWSSDLYDASLITINLNEEKLTEGLKNGLIGVRSGEICEILFSGQYGFGEKAVGIVPKNSALAYKIWVMGVTNE